jgi:hypothetical protein
VSWFVSSGAVELKDSIVANDPVSASVSSRFAINVSSTTRFGKLNNTIVHGCGAAYAGYATPSASDNNQFSQCIRIANDTQFSPTFYAVGSIASWRTNSGNDVNSTVAPWTAPAGFYDMTIEDPVIDP